MTVPRHEDRRVQLTIKIGSLADEAKRIRKRERRAMRDARVNSTGRELLRPITTKEGIAVLRLAQRHEAAGLTLEFDDEELKTLRREGREARLVVYRENRPKGRDRNLRLARDLGIHRKGVVRSEARHSQLALAFLRGRLYRSVESRVRDGNEPNIRSVAGLVVRFGSILGSRQIKPGQRIIQEVHYLIRGWMYPSLADVQPDPPGSDEPAIVAGPGTCPNREKSLDPSFPVG